MTATPDRKIAPVIRWTVRGRRIGRLVTVAVLIALVTLAGGCGGGRQGEARDDAQRLADELYPGRLSVIDVQTSIGGPIPVPVTTVTFSVADAPDAVVTLTGIDADTLRAALDRALWEAEELGAVREALAGGDFELLGSSVPEAVDDGLQLTVYLSAAVDEGSVAEVQARLDQSLSGWVSSRGSAAYPRLTSPLSSLSVRLVDPDQAQALPDHPDPRMPGLGRLSYAERVSALERATTQIAFVTRQDDGRPWPITASLAPRLSDDDQGRVDRAVVEAATRWVAPRGLDLRLATFTTWPRLEPGTIRRLRTYTLACPPSVPECTLPRASHAVASTVDLATLEVRDFRLVPSTRRPDGGWTQPLEPERL